MPARSRACSMPMRQGNQQLQKARAVCVACNSIESPRLLLNSASSHVPGRPRQLLGPGRAQLHAPHHGLGLRDLRAAGAHVPRHDDGRDHHRRVAARHRARLRRRLRAGDPLARPAVHGGVPRARRLGHASSAAAMEDYDHMAGMWIVGEDMPQESNRRHPARRGEGPVGPADPQRALRRPRQRPRDAQPRLQAGPRGL